MTPNITNLSEEEILDSLRFTQNTNLMISLPVELKDNKEFILKVLNINVYYFSYISDSLKNDLEVARFVVSKSGSLLEYMGLIPRSDPDIVKQAMLIEPGIFKYASTSLKDNIDVAYAAINADPILFEHVSNRLKNDKTLALYAITADPYNFSYCSDELRDDKDVAIAALTRYPHGLGLVSKRLKDDPEIVKLAIYKDGLLLRFASFRLRSDVELVLDAVYNHAAALESSPQFENDALVRYVYDATMYCPIQSQDWPMVKKALLTNPDIFINPPALIKDLIDSMAYPYLCLAEYALNSFKNAEDTTFDIEFAHD